MAHIIAHIFIVYPAGGEHVQWARLAQQFIELHSLYARNRATARLAYPVVGAFLVLFFYLRVRVHATANSNGAAAGRRGSSSGN